MTETLQELLSRKWFVEMLQEAVGELLYRRIFADDYEVETLLQLRKMLDSYQLRMEGV
jgi:hypothetical protein